VYSGGAPCARATSRVAASIGGAAINAAFVDHFQTLARGHFVVRRLERTYGKGTVRRAYDQIRMSEGL